MWGLGLLSTRHVAYHGPKHEVRRCSMVAWLHFQLLLHARLVRHSLWLGSDSKESVYCADVDVLRVSSFAWIRSPPLLCLRLGGSVCVHLGFHFMRSPRHERWTEGAFVQMQREIMAFAGSLGRFSDSWASSTAERGHAR